MHHHGSIDHINLSILKLISNLTLEVDDESYRSSRQSSYTTPLIVVDVLPTAYKITGLLLQKLQNADSVEWSNCGGYVLLSSRLTHDIMC